MTRIYPILALTAALLLVACAEPPFDATAEGAKLSQRDAEFSKVSQEGKDIEKIVSYWSDDAQVIVTGQPASVGKIAIREFVTTSLKIPGFKIHWLSSKPVFSPDGKMAYLSSDVETTAPGANGALATTHARSLTIWRRAGDGEWRCVMDIASDSPAPT
jgi:ketosteroid isomerase-like protein